MAGRYYFAWKMLAAADAQDWRNDNARAAARARAAYNPLVDLTETQFQLTYRLNKSTFKLLCKDLKELTNLRSSQRVSLELKLCNSAFLIRNVLTALFFYATGSYQRPVGIAKHISQKMCSMYIEEVTNALISHNILAKYIRFPETPSARQAVSARFHTKYGMPGVVGCVDGSHFKIVVPPKNVEHMYYSRKHYHSLNVQMVCDDEYRILSVNPKFGGANHDAFIWENSNISTYMQSLHQNGEMVWLLGDSGYPQRPWMMTPILDAVPGSPESHYNEIHRKARVVIENTFSRLKNRWRCLHKDRVLHYKPLKCANIILACSVLHNMGLNCTIENRTTTEENIDIESQANEEAFLENAEATTELIRGRIIRNLLVHRL